MSGPLASVVVAVRDDRHRTNRLLESLLCQTLSADRYEIIIVENGSRELADVDGLGSLVLYRHLPCANTAAARNVGLAMARGRYLLLTDSDCVAERDWVEKMIRALDNGHAVVGGAIGKYNPTTWTQRCAITIVNGQQTLSYLPALHLPYVAGANAGFDTTALREAGGFDEDLRSGNDIDICYKLGLRGHALALVPDATVWHEDRATVSAHFRRFWYYAVYQVLLFAKYKHVSRRRMVLDGYPIRRLVGALCSGPRALLRLACGDRDPAGRVVLQIVEAVAVVAGEIQGSVRFRQLYL